MIKDNTFKIFYVLRCNVIGTERVNNISMLKLLRNDKIKDKFVLHIIRQSIDWQWLIDYIEKEYKCTDCHDWNNYFEIFGNSIPEPIRIFVQIMNNVDEKSMHLNFKRKNIQQMWDIAMFFNNEISWEDAIKKVNIDSLKVILLALYITKLINKKNNTNFNIFWNILINTNLFQIYNLTLIEENRVKIFNYLNTINLKNIDTLKNVLLSNINQVEKTYNNNLLLNIEGKDISLASFRFKTKPSQNNLSWQENTIINMLETTLVESKFIPKINFLMKYPDIGPWNKNIIKLLKSYFGENNKIANFVIETVYYLRNRKDAKNKQDIKHNREYLPSDKVINMHLQLIVNAIKGKEKTICLIETSSMYLLSCLFKDGATATIKQNSNFKQIIRWNKMQPQPEIYYQKRLQKMGFPISSDNQLWIEESSKRNLKKITTLFDFCRYLNQKDLVKVLTEKQLKEVRKKFWAFLNNGKTTVMELSGLFIDYAKFLTRCFNNEKLNKSLLNSEIIRIQLLWENDVYSRLINGMVEKKVETTISDKTIDNFNKLFIVDPIAVSNQLLPVDEYNMFKQLNTNSDHPIMSIITRVWIENIFPQQKSDFDLKHHKVEGYFIEYLDKIKRKYQYLFLNNLETKSDLLRMFSYYDITISFIKFLDKKQMYDQVVGSCQYDIDPYTEKTTLGLVTQLFPILEMKIRRVASYCGISPFKNNSFNDVGVKYKDPSSLLMQIISDIYNDKKDLLRAQGFIFVYLTMYDSNFKNIRNDLIHGRNYLKDADLDFAFRCTLLSISIMNYYLDKARKGANNYIK